MGFWWVTRSDTEAKRTRWVFFDSIKGEAKRNFIARADEAKGEIIYKYPEKNIRMLTQLTVDADEVALFVKDGKVEGKLGAGPPHAGHQEHPVPVARCWRASPAATCSSPRCSSSPRASSPGVKFGGPIGDVRDPETGLGIGTMVYGDFSIRVTEPEKLVVGLVGMGRSSNEDFLGWFKNQVLKVTARPHRRAAGEEAAGRCST